MHVRIYENPEKLSSSVWAMRHPRETNYELMMGQETEAVVGGANADHFFVDGLYSTEVYVVAHGTHVYVLMGAYLEKGDQYQADFAALVDSFTFISNGSGGAQGKIDPRVACKQALAFMTFPDGAAADKFVAECEAGEHPEVIQNYIDGLGLDGATI